jgi:hypothetical protein
VVVFVGNDRLLSVQTVHVENNLGLEVGKVTRCRKIYCRMMIQVFCVLWCTRSKSRTENFLFVFFGSRRTGRPGFCLGIILW